MVKKNTCIFISGKGTNLKISFYALETIFFPIKVSLVISNNKNAFGLEYAKKYKIPFVLIDTKLKNYENKILLNLKKYNISFICFAGFMKIISIKLIKYYQKKLLIFTPLYYQNIKG